jgi:Fic family protein
MIEQGRLRFAERLPEVHSGGGFRPTAISGGVFIFRTDTQTKESKAVADLVRFDERMRLTPHAVALMRALLRAEATTTVRTDGICPDLEQVIFLEEAERLGKAKPREQKNFLFKWFPQSDQQTRETSFEAFRSIEALRYIMESDSCHRNIQMQDILTLHELCMRGTRREYTSSIRSSKMRYRWNSGSNVYNSPDAKEIIPLLEDLVAFNTRSDISPILKSIITHFQLEAIKPFDEGVDRLGRMLALLIQRQGGLMENTITPFSLTPAVFTQRHTELLIPYQTGQGFGRINTMQAIDKWAAHSSDATSRSVKYAEIYGQRIEAQIENWRMVLGDANNVGLDKVLIDLAALPVISVADIMEVANKTFQTANEYVTILMKLGILRPITTGKRNRLFIAQEAMEMLKEVEQKLLPKDAIAMETFIT